MRQRKNSLITSRWSVGLRQISGLNNQSKEKFSNSQIRDQKKIKNSGQKNPCRQIPARTIILLFKII